MVIGIIGLLAAIITPVVMQSLTKARNAAIKAEIDMLHMAIMNYKNEYGSFPPCLSGTTLPTRDITHLRRLFPRISIGDAAAQLALASVGTSGLATDASCRNQIAALTPRTALVFWLDGFTENPLSPLAPASERKKLFDFDQSRKQQTNTTPKKFTGIYSPSGKPEAEYWYMLSAPALQPELLALGFRAVYDANGVNFNPDSFQIVSPGRDGIWHEDYNDNNILDAGEDLNGNRELDKSDDDLSNFWPGTRREYLDSLKD